MNEREDDFTKVYRYLTKPGARTSAFREQALESTRRIQAHIEDLERANNAYRAERENLEGALRDIAFTTMHCTHGSKVRRILARAALAGEPTISMGDSAEQYRLNEAIGENLQLRGALRMIRDLDDTKLADISMRAIARAALAGEPEPPTTCPEDCALKGTGTPHSQHVGHTVPTGTAIRAYPDEIEGGTENDATVPARTTCDHTGDCDHGYPAPTDTP